MAPAVCAEQEIPVHKHDVSLDVARLSIAASYGVTDDVDIALETAASRKETGVRYRTLDGAPFDPPYGDIHHRDGEAPAGFEDIGLLVRMGSGRRLGRHYLQGEAGVSIPTGRTVENPYRLGSLGLKHEHVQFGTGTLDPRLGLLWSYGKGVVRPFAFGSARFSPSRNDQGYKQGTYANLGGGATFRAWRTDIAVQTGVVREGADDWTGIQGTREESSGRVVLWASLGASWTYAGLDLRPDVRWNVHESALGETILRQPLLFTLTLGHTFVPHPKEPRR